MLVTILQVTFLSCTGMLTSMTSSLHIIKLKLKTYSVLRSKLVEKASPYIFPIHCLSKWRHTYRSMRKYAEIAYRDVTCTSSTVSPYFFPIHLATAHMWKHSCNDIKRIHSINTHTSHTWLHCKGLSLDKTWHGGLITVPHTVQHAACCTFSQTPTHLPEHISSIFE